VSSAAARRAGIALVALGILVILGAVIVVLEVANGPGSGPKTFAERRSYDQVKESVQRVYPIAFPIGLGGLGLALLGSRILKRTGSRP
jgi:hypothetical protein